MAGNNSTLEFVNNTTLYSIQLQRTFPILDKPQHISVSNKNRIIAFKESHIRVLCRNIVIYSFDGTNAADSIWDQYRKGSRIPWPTLKVIVDIPKIDRNEQKYAKCLVHYCHSNTSEFFVVAGENDDGRHVTTAITFALPATI